MFFSLVGTNPKGLDYKLGTENPAQVKSWIKNLYSRGVREFTLNGKPVSQEMIDLAL